MSEIEQAYGFGWQEYDEGQHLAMQTLETIQDVLMDEDPDVERPDIWYVTWAELQQPDDHLGADDRFNRRAASNEIQALYKQALEYLYPQLRSAKSAADKAVQTALIDDLPECNGTFTASAYESADGHHRQLACATVYLDNLDYGLTLSAMAIDRDDNKAYRVVMHADGSIEVNYGVPRDADPVVNAMLEKIPSLQVDNLARVLYGQVWPVDLESKLTEIRVGSESEMSAAELDELIRQAETMYYNAVADMMMSDDIDADNSQSTINYLREMLAIASGRRQQLQSDL